MSGDDQGSGTPAPAHGAGLDLDRIKWAADAGFSATPGLTLALVKRAEAAEAEVRRLRAHVEDLRAALRDAT